MAMHPAPWGDRFQTGSVEHCLAIAAIVGASAVVAMAGRAAHRRGRERARQFDLTLATLLATYWIAIKLRNLLPGHLGWDHSLPLHICDLAMVSAAVGLATWRRMPRNVLFFWGLGLCPNALLLPNLYLGPRFVDFWVYWLSHGAITMAAVYELAVRGYRPRWRDGTSILALNVLYTAMAVCVDGRLGVNYGFLGPHVWGSEILAFGEWPMRVPRLLAAACGVHLLMALAPLALAVCLRAARSMRRQRGQAELEVSTCWPLGPRSQPPEPVASAA